MWVWLMLEVLYRGINLASSIWQAGTRDLSHETVLHCDWLHDGLKGQLSLRNGNVT